MLAARVSAGINTGVYRAADEMGGGGGTIGAIFSGPHLAF